MSPVLEVPAPVPRRPRRLPSWVPRGGSLPEDAWRARHRFVTCLLALHLVGVPLYAWVRDESALRAVQTLAPVFILLLFACTPWMGRSARASSAAFGLMYCSGVIVHLSNGLVEAHFHFFVIIPVVALYEAWMPFGLGVVYVLVHHGWMGTVDPRMVYNHPGAWEHPWLFAAVHAAFFACACLACIVNWSLHERARETSQAQSSLLATIVDSMHDGLVVTDTEGGVLLRNRAGTELLSGVRWREPVPGSRAAEVGQGLRHADGAPVPHQQMPHVQALAGHDVHDLDLVVDASAGDDLTVLSFSATALGWDPDVRTRPVVVVARDVTERHRVQQAVSDALASEKAAVEQLRALEQVKSDLVSTVSHELRTPITSIMGYLELLEDALVGNLNEAQADLLTRVDRNCKRLLLMVEDLLTHSQIESATLAITTSTRDLRDVVVSAHAAVVPLLAGRDVRLHLDLPDSPVLHEVDPTALERMAVNLLTNAVKFTPAGGRVDVRLSKGEHAVTLVVADDGLGIPEDEQDRLFTRFFRSATASEHAIQGTGLGLSIVRAIVQLHGGTIAVVSAPGVGTTFTVQLPLVAATSEPTPVHTPELGEPELPAAV